MKKYIRTHLKNEKRALKLMYRKGMFEILGIELKDLAWECLLKGKRGRKRKRKYGFIDWLPELHSYSCDYWGEWDSISVVTSMKDYFHWELSDEIDEIYGYPKGKYFTTLQLIKHLSLLPTKKHDSKFNRIINLDKSNL